MLTPEELRDWFKKETFTYYEDDLEGFGIDGQIDLIELCKFINEKYKEK